MVEIAGGHEVLGKAGSKSERITPERILEAQPEIIVLMPCGFSLERTVEEYRRTRFLPGWSGQLYAVDGSSYFNRSGPRLIDGVEILSEIFHPSLLDGPERGENRSEEHTSELQSRLHLVCRLLLEKKRSTTCRDESSIPS